MMRTEKKVQLYIKRTITISVISVLILSFIYNNFLFSSSYRNLTAQTIETVAKEELTDPGIIDEDPLDVMNYDYRKGMISAGLYHTILLNEKGRVFTWGDNTYGQLGLGNLENAESPTEVFGISDVVMVSAGAYHSMALTADGNIYIWGRNSFGQVGNNSTETVVVPVRLSGIPPVKQISAGAFHSLALTINGEIYGWGNNTDGQIGDVTSQEVLDEVQNVLGLRVISPQKIDLGKVVFVSAGGYHSLALMNDGSVFAWGDNKYGQLGDGTTISRNKPEKTQVLNSVVQISAGYNHSFAVTKLLKKSNETLSLSISDELYEGESAYYRSLYSWGSNSTGQLGLGDLPEGTEFASVPRRVNLTGDANHETDYVYLADAGYFSSMATVKDMSSQSERDNLYVWGNNTYGQLGIGALPSRNIPLKLAGVSNGWMGDSFLPFQSISSGGYHAALLSVKGFLGTMGRADRGQLGNTSIINSFVPVGIPLEDAISPEWESEEKLSTRIQQNNLILQWNNAKDNIKVESYEINYENENKEPITLSVKESENTAFTTRIITDIDLQSNQVITVFAIDKQGNKSTRPLRYYLNSGNFNNPDSDPSTPEYDYNDRLVWSAENYGEIKNLEVPWDVDYVYGIGVVMPPPDNSLIIAVFVTILVMLFFLMAGVLAFKKNHRDTRIFGDIIRFRSRKYHKENDKTGISEYNVGVGEVTEKTKDDHNEHFHDEISIEISESRDDDINSDSIGFLTKIKKKFTKSKD